MTTKNPTSPIFELRVAVTTADYDRLVDFYCTGLGIAPAQVWESGVAKGLLLETGRATLEIFNEAQAEMVDQIEVGRRAAGPIRFAMQVPDLDAAVERMTAAGAVLVHEPVTTPWGDRNARLQDPDGMQITLFETKE